MRDMRAHHQKAIVADLGDKIAFFRHDIDRYIFPEHTTGADLEFSGKSRVSHDLPRLTDRCEGKDLRTLTNFGFTFDDDVLMQANPAGENDPGSDHAIGADHHVGSDGAFNDGSRMDR